LYELARMGLQTNHHKFLFFTTQRVINFLNCSDLTPIGQDDLIKTPKLKVGPFFDVLNSKPDFCCPKNQNIKENQ
jgi:hypothetical protein